MGLLPVKEYYCFLLKEILCEFACSWCGCKMSWKISLAKLCLILLEWDFVREHGRFLLYEVICVGVIDPS